MSFSNSFTLCVWRSLKWKRFGKCLLHSTSHFVKNCNCQSFFKHSTNCFFFQSRLMSYFAVWPLKVYKALAINCGLLASLLTLSSSSLRLLASSASYSRLNRSSSSSLFLLIISSSASLLLLSSSSLRLCSSSSSSLLRRAASSSRLLNTSSSEGGCCLTCSSSDAFLAEPCYDRSNQSQPNHIIRATSFVYGQLTQNKNNNARGEKTPSIIKNWVKVCT